jgi:hypothetical protein
MEKYVVYTAIAGGKNDLLEPDFPDPTVRQICFTDYNGFSSPSWEFIEIPSEIIEKFTDSSGEIDYTRVAKIFKLQPHLFPHLQKYEASLWVDGSIQLKMRSISAFIKTLLRKSDFQVFRNPDRASVQEEVKYCIDKKKDEPSVLLAQLSHYRDQGFPDSGGLMKGGFILRRTNSTLVKRMNNLWWSELLRWSKRDEVSFPYLAWLHNFQYDFFPWRSIEDCPEIKLEEHRR